MSSAAVTGSAALLPQTELELSIKGMTCAACAAGGEEAQRGGPCSGQREFRDREGRRHRAAVGFGGSAHRGGGAGRLWRRGEAASRGRRRGEPWGRRRCGSRCLSAGPADRGGGGPPRAGGRRPPPPARPPR